MGCDIHAHFEIKVNGKWEHYTIPKIDRYYRLFGKMAGVRNGDERPIAPLRGLPKDMSIVTALDAERWNGDGHSHSWLSAEEIAELSDWGERSLQVDTQRSYRSVWDMEFDWGCYFFGNSFAGFHKYPDERPEGVEDLRLVFWFDN